MKLSAKIDNLIANCNNIGIEIMAEWKNYSNYHNNGESKQKNYFALLQHCLDSRD